MGGNLHQISYSGILRRYEVWLVTVAFMVRNCNLNLVKLLLIGYSSLGGNFGVNCDLIVWSLFLV